MNYNELGDLSLIDARVFHTLFDFRDVFQYLNSNTVESILSLFVIGCFISVLPAYLFQHDDDDLIQPPLDVPVTPIKSSLRPSPVPIKKAILEVIEERDKLFGRVWLNVSYKDREDAKKMGAKWHSIQKKWYTYKDSISYPELIEKYGIL